MAKCAPWSGLGSWPPRLARHLLNAYHGTYWAGLLSYLQARLFIALQRRLTGRREGA